MSRRSRTRGGATGRSFGHAASPEEAEPLFERFCALLETEGVHVARGVCGARMQVSLVNDGPVTIVLDS